ncbi:Carboxylesterase [Teladorsagia circumcincta]|uniref:Carboxylesterase n=1 Tax=Teladorsagia circumcincta TaxID=45464 RepID=A0A2G9UHD9_TELCI|nr:Carboxylesterase [Teladorsagia circumcincta]
MAAVKTPPMPAPKKPAAAAPASKGGPAKKARRYCVVFVISAFRLGIFGVLEFADESVVPRNLPLYDIIAGLEMVHSEVEAFGGDPKRVTLMGHSQGGSIVVVFTVSSIIDPDHRLFQQVLALSPAINYRIRSNMIDITWRLAHEAGCTTSRFRPDRSAPSEDANAVACLRKVDALELLAKQRSLEERGMLMDGIVYGPPFVNEDLPIEDFVMESSARPMICTLTRFEFDMWKTEKTDDVGSFLRVSHPEQVREKYFYDMSFKDWLPFDPSKRNYYSVEANFEKGIFPSNKMDYHSEIVDYWLHNMTEFDESLSRELLRKKIPLQRKKEAPALKEEAPAPKKEDPAPKGEAPVPKKEDLAPKGEAPAPKKEDPAPKGEAPAPRKEATAQKKEATAPKEEAPAPKKENPAPKEEAPAPRKEATAQKKEATAPKEEAPAPKKENPAPKEEAPCS